VTNQTTTPQPAPAYTWAESVASTGIGPTATIEIDIHVPGHTTPIPVEVPLAEARTLHTMLGDVLAEHEPPADERAAHEPTEPWLCDDCGATVPAGQAWCTAPKCPDPGRIHAARVRAQHDPCAHGCRQAADELTRLGEEMEQPAEQVRDLPLELDGAALWLAIREHAARDHAWWNRIDRARTTRASRRSG